MLDAPNSEKKQSSEVTLIYSILGLVILVAFGMPIFQSKHIYPRFINLIIENTENECIRIGNNMMRMVLNDYSGGTLVISDNTKVYLNQTSRDYNLWKVKVFSEIGETIYSTALQDVGTLNHHPYFHEVVVKGKVYTKVVLKDSKSLEGQLVTHDVVETYIPIMQEGKFVGAFELYYNISVRKKSMDKIMAQSTSLLYCLTVIILVVVLWIVVGLRRRMKEREIFEDTLYNMAIKDTLTGIYNRRRFIELLKWEVNKFIRYEMNTSLLMFDIDHFKNVNDTNGHQAGDEVLVAVAKTCKILLRESDLLARYGGEEFVVLLPGTGKVSAIETAEKLRQAIASLTTPYGNAQIRVTITVNLF